MGKVIQVEAMQRLLSIDFIYALARALISLRLSRRKVLDWLAELIFGWLEDGGIFVDEFGNELIFSDETIDDVHGKDATLRVISSIIDYGRGKPRRRRGRFTMYSLMCVYDAAFKVAAIPLLPEARQAEVALTRKIVRNFSPVRRTRYLQIVSQLRRDHQGERSAYYSAAIRRVRLRFAEEQAYWYANR